MRDKINSIRLMIISAEGERRQQIDPKCRDLTSALRAIEFEPGRSSYDKRSKFGHIIDATGHLTLAISRGLTPWSLGQSGFKIYG